MYTPSQELLKKYADILVKFALRSGEGVRKNDVVFVQIPECAKPFYLPLQKAILEAGAHPIMEYLADGVSKHFFEHANDDQIIFYPSHFLNGKVAQMTHVISIIAEDNKHELEGIDPDKLSSRKQSRKEYMDRRREKENQGKMTRTLGLYGTKAMADEVGLSLEEYWNQIIKACYLDFQDPISERKKTENRLSNIKKHLDDMYIEYVHIKGDDADLSIKIGSDRKRLAGSGRNIPSFEVFTSPDWRETNGWMRFNQPLYVYGQLIKGIELHFKDGIITKFSAKENEAMLKSMIQTPGADKLGEFSLTDSRISHITTFMGEILYDENIGGEYGNTHVAIGNAYYDTYRGDVSKLNDEDIKRVGFNTSAEHTDIISTTNRTVTATLKDGSKKVIYKDGQFQFPID